ncbi:MAG: TetR/AcrR family transcriptional regulator [Alistipes sp.]|nr:TetR/AcrR family transcriptional regulator [Candidatus Alistipes equi]
MSDRGIVVEKAANYIMDYGLKSLRMDDLAQQLAMSKRTLYEMFSDKEQLIYESLCFLHEAEHMRVREKVHTYNNHLAALFDGFLIMTEKSHVHKRITQNLQKFYPALYEKVQTEFEKKSFEDLRRLLRNYIDEGLIKSEINIELAVVTFHFTAHGIISSSKLSLPEGVTEKEALFYAIVNFFRGLATLRGVEQIDQYMKNKNEILYKIDR